jgi:hypothetical protein
MATPRLFLAGKFQFRMRDAPYYRFRVSAFHTPQFSLAESAGPAICSTAAGSSPAPTTALRATMACPACTDTLRAAMAKSDSSAYPFALVCGMGAAIVGMILYSAFTILTGWIVRYVSLAFGWMVGNSDQERPRRTTRPDHCGISRLGCHLHVRSTHWDPLREATPAGVAPNADVRPKFPTRKTPHARAARARQQDLAAWQRQLRTSLANPMPTVFPPVRTHPRRLPIL